MHALVWSELAKLGIDIAVSLSSSFEDREGRPVTLGDIKGLRDGWDTSRDAIYAEEARRRAAAENNS